MIEPAIYVTALAYELGEHEHDLMEFDKVLPGVRESLRDAGVRTYRVSDRSPVELARASLGRTLDKFDEAWRGDIRHLLYATNSVWDPSFADTAAIGALLSDLGLHQTYPIGLFLSYCANLESAFDLGAALLARDATDRVLAVCTDKADPESDRLVQPRISVHSDGAASFLMTREPLPGSFLLRQTALHIDGALGAVDPDERFTEYLTGASEGIMHVVKEVLDAAGLSPSDICKVFPNNYNNRVSRIVGELLGFDTAQLFLENIPRFAHAMAADGLINLADWTASNGASSGEKLLLLGTGPNQWGCSLLESMP